MGSAIPNNFNSNHVFVLRNLVFLCFVFLSESPKETPVECQKTEGKDGSYKDIG